MFNALNGIGGAGLDNPHAADAANTAVYATFAVIGFFAGQCRVTFEVCTVTT
jgi:hypothetical protein